MLFVCVFVCLFVGLLGEEECSVCPGFQLQRDYCAPNAVVLGHIRLKRAVNSDSSYYIVNVNQIFRRTFKIKIELIRVFTSAVCGMELDVGESYILGIELDENGLLTFSRCSLALKYQDTSAIVRSAVTKRRVDCGCTGNLCGHTMCSPSVQLHVNTLDPDTSTECLSKTAFCGRYEIGSKKGRDKGPCCWTANMPAFTECYAVLESEAELTEATPTESLPPIEFTYLEVEEEEVEEEEEEEEEETSNSETIHFDDEVKVKI